MAVMAIRRLHPMVSSALISLTVPVRDMRWSASWSRPYAVLGAGRFFKLQALLKVPPPNEEDSYES